MSNSYLIEPPAASPKVRITAGTAFKLGFFGALGIFAFYLIFSIVFGIVRRRRPGRRAATDTAPAAAGF